MLRIHHPRILMALLLVMGLIGGTVAVIVNDQDPYGAPVSLPIPTQLPLDEAAKQAAVDIVRQSGAVERIAGNQSWTASYFFRSAIAGTTNGVGFIASWEQPVESSGPWSLVRCRGTRAFSSSNAWANVTRLKIDVDVELREVVGLSVRFKRPVPGETPPLNAVHVSGPGPDYQGAVRDLETRQVIFSGLATDAPDDVRVCPPGKEDD